MQDDSPLARTIAMVADLRARCSWDRIQSRETLRPYLIEEVHELDAAIADGDAAAVRDEVADLMLHLAWQLVLGAELGEFTAADIADDVIAKMRRRHPHLFDLGPAEPWDQLKRRERATRRGALAGLPATLPRLLLAFRLQERAASAGFDWPDTDGPTAKVREELAEVTAELEGGTTQERIAAEIGDLLFAVVNLARKANVAPDAALDQANRKFSRRFERVEALAAERALGMDSANLAALDALWDEVKSDEG